MHQSTYILGIAVLFLLHLTLVSSSNHFHTIKTSSLIQKQQQKPIILNNKLYSSKMSQLKGGNNENQVTDTPKVDNQYVLRSVLGIWGSFQVLAMLGNAIQRLSPIAFQPFIQKDFQPIHWALYIVFTLIMAYSEGYRGFHKKFSPMAVERAFGIVDNLSIFSVLLAGPYSMGLFGASRKRMIVSWMMTIGVFCLVVIVKRVPYPYRSIIDAGVVMGLTLGSISIIWYVIQSLLGNIPKTTTETTEKKQN